MSRPPSMSVEEAAAILGAPESFVINSDNRAVVRKWATAKGWSSHQIYPLNNAMLETLYRTGRLPTETTPPVATVPMIRNDVPVTPINPTEDTTPMTPALFAPVAPAAQSASSAADALAAAIRQIAESATIPVDLATVHQIVEEALASHESGITEARVREMIEAAGVGIQRLEIKAPDGNVRTIEGTVHAATKTALQVVALNHPVMLIGPAGCGKTTIGQHIAVALGLDFYITSTVFDTHELLGFVDGYGKYHTTAFRNAYEHGGVWVADEIDAWDAAALLAANSAIANGVATFPDSNAPIRRHENFRIVATANTYGHGADRVYVGRNELDAATLDRFATIDVDYDAALETALSNNPDWFARVTTIRAAIRKHSLRYVVSTRAITMGQSALAAGMDRTTVEALYLFKGMTESDRKQIES